MKPLLLRKTASFLVCSLFLQVTAQAQGLAGYGYTGPSPRASNNQQNASPPVTSQYKFVPVPDQGLVPVYILGGVRKPGIHYVPTSSNVLNLLALAGGTTEDAKTREITVSAPTNASADSYKVVHHFDMRGYLRKDVDETSGTLPQLKSNYVVYVPEYRPAIDRDLTGVVSFIGALASIVLTFVVIKRDSQ